MIAASVVATAIAGCIAAPPPARYAATPAASPAQPRREAVRRVTLNEEILPSGLRIVLEEDPVAAMAGVVAVVRGGSGADPEGAEGLAHLVEHLTYRAVDPPLGGDRALTRWDQLIRYAVAEMNGFTTPDCLMFYEFAAPGQLRSLLALEVARLADPLAGVDEAAFAVERQVIGGEHLVRDDPRLGEWAANDFFPGLFPPQHPYARPTGGTDDSRRRLTLAAARAFAARVFRPELTTLLVSAPPGTISLPALRALVPPVLRGAPERRVPRPAGPRPEAIPTGAAPLPAAPVAATPGPLAVQRKTSPMPTPELWVGWTLPGSYGGLGATEELLQSWLQEDLRSDQLAQEDRHIRNVNVWLQKGLSASALLVRTLLAPGADPEHVAQVVVARVASLWAREPASSHTFGQLRTLSESQRILGLPGQVQRALQQAVWATLTERVRPFTDLLVATEAVRSTAVAELAYRQLTRERARVVSYAPGAPPKAARVASSAWRPPVAGQVVVDLVPGAAAWDANALAGLLPPIPAVSVSKLATGLTVATVRRPGASAVAWLGFRGGYSDAEPPLLVELALRTQPEANGAVRFHILPGRGATRAMSFDGMEFLPEQLGDALTLLFAKATAAVKDWPSREGLERLLAPVAATEDAPTKAAERAFGRALFGDHPYARIVRSDDLEKVTRADVDAWLGRVHNMRAAALVVVGDVDHVEVERAATILSQQVAAPTWVADLPAPPAPAARPASADRLVPVITPRSGALTDIRIGCLLPPMRAADRGHYELLKHAVEARLNAALRIEDGDGYGVNASYGRLRDGTAYLVAATFVGDSALTRALAALRGHWQRWARSGLEPGEINVARWRYAGSVAAGYANLHAVALQLLDQWGTDPAALKADTLRPDLVGLNAARVNELFATCKANAVLGLTGNEGLINHALDQAWPGLRR